MKTPALRTPDDRFAVLPDFPFRPHYRGDLPGFEGLRLHYLDEGSPAAREVYLCLHGQPTWSYLYRKMIPRFTAAGARVIAPDLFGFGRSDKPKDEGWYTFSRHRDLLLAFVEAMDLQRTTLVCHDWGGLLGMTLPMAAPERYARLLVMNTMLATGDAPLGKGFVSWRSWANDHPDFRIGALLRRACPQLSERESAAYDAPYPDATYKSGVRRFPNLVCDAPDADGAAVSRAARTWWATRWSGDAFMAIGMKDGVIPPAAMHSLRAGLRNCAEPLELADAGHFVPEWGEPIAEAALAHWAT